jgi:tRNA threonylcarbamoyl adenosine modification protein YjeE
MNMAGTSWTTFLPDEDATLHLAGQMAKAMPMGGPPFVLHLHGDLGTGKTTLTRGALRALGEQGAVRSPTYGLIAEYATPRGRVLHLDLYRLRSAGELQALGLADYLADSQLWLIEWPERAEGERLPAADARIYLDVEATGRRARIEACSAPGRLWLARLNPDPSS